MTRPKGFTLIEILIVVAILAILAMISIPNFLNAQIRAKVARMQSDLQAVASAIEMYALDRGALPSPRWSLTTPVAYIGVIPIDIITRRAGFRFAGDPADYTRDPVPIGYGSTGSKEPYPYHYFVSSVGPNEQVDLPEFHYITGRGFFCVP